MELREMGHSKEVRMQMSPVHSVAHGPCTYGMDRDQGQSEQQ